MDKRHAVIRAEWRAGFKPYVRALELGRWPAVSFGMRYFIFSLLALASRKVRITRGEGEERHIIDVDTDEIIEDEKDDIILKPGDKILALEIVC